MATKTIIATVTLHVAGPRFMPMKFNQESGVTEGVYDVIDVPPGRQATIDADEADALIARGIAEEAPPPLAPVSALAAPVAPPVPDIPLPASASRK